MVAARSSGSYVRPKKNDSNVFTHLVDDPKDRMGRRVGRNSSNMNEVTSSANNADMLERMMQGSDPRAAQELASREF